MTNAAEWDRVVDVIVVGTGGAALVAATLAHDAGSEVLIVEKADMIGGTTVGLGWRSVASPATTHMAEAGNRGEPRRRPGLHPAADDGHRARSRAARGLRGHRPGDAPVPSRTTRRSGPTSPRCPTTTGRGGSPATDRCPPGRSRPTPTRLAAKSFRSGSRPAWCQPRARSCRWGRPPRSPRTSPRNHPGARGRAGSSRSRRHPAQVAQRFIAMLFKGLLERGVETRLLETAAQASSMHR